jgi:hypothetical protein
MDADRRNSGRLGLGQVGLLAATFVGFGPITKIEYTCILVYVLVLLKKLVYVFVFVLKSWVFLGIPRHTLNAATAWSPWGRPDD